jgi:signal transduction histidine kinase
MVVQRRPPVSAPAALAGTGIGLALVAAAWHLAVEPGRVADPRGPLLAVLLDGLLPLALVYGGYRLARSDLAPERRWTVVRWAVAGALVFVAATWVTVFVRRFEGRTLAEPAFELLVAADVGTLAGAVAGYYSARARHDAARARRTRAALGFVNRLLRHDLRNDINVVRGRAAGLAERDDEDVRESATVIARQADRMDDLVDSTDAIAEALLDEGGDWRIDLTAVVADAVEAVDTRDATVVTDLPDSAPVAANGALRSVVANLVENAVEHGSTGSRPPPDDAAEHGSTGNRTPPRDTADLRIETSVTVEGETVRLRVADDGPGIPDDERGDLFEPRTGTDHGGGLHLVAQLVEQFDGSITVEESERGGAAFVVDLPRADDCDNARDDSGEGYAPRSGARDGMENVTRNAPNAPGGSGDRDAPR